MTWTIDESRVRPFLTAAERHDVPALLWNALQPGRAFPGQQDTEVPDAGRPPEARKRFKDFKDFKDGKDGKEHKDGKDGKEVKEMKEMKDVKDTKDGKDRKDTKDNKDGKDFKDGKDSFDGAMAPPGPAAVVRQQREPSPPGPAGMPQRYAAAAELPDDGPEQAAAALRASRINRLLRRRGVVI